MATSRTIKNRIKATKNIEQITKAMQAVSAVKMRRSQQAAISGRPYALAALEILKNVRRAIKEDENPDSLINEKKGNKTALVVVTSDKGLAGSFNTNVLRKSQIVIKNSTMPIDIVAVGKRGRDFWSRRLPSQSSQERATAGGLRIIREFFGSGDYVTLEQTLPIAKYLNELYRSGEYNEIIIIYTNFISALKQQVMTRKILPVSVEGIEEIIQEIIPETGLYSGKPEAIDRNIDIDDKTSFIFEPSAEEVLNELISRLVGIQLHQSILEANASEHSSRMVAMRSASENAGELISSLGITYNKLRQAAITKELTEISAGTEALAAAN